MSNKCMLPFIWLKTIFIQVKMTTNWPTGRYTVSRVLQLFDTNQSDVDNNSSSDKESTHENDPDAVVGRSEEEEQQQGGGDDEEE